MRVIKLKDWGFEDKSLVKSGRITECGLKHYWDAVDSALKFNATKREVFVARLVVMAAPKPKSSTGGNESDKPNIASKRLPATATQQILSNTYPREDDMYCFFRRHRNDQFHWHRMNDAREDLCDTLQRRPRYLLPHLSNR